MLMDTGDPQSASPGVQLRASNARVFHYVLPVPMLDARVATHVLEWQNGEPSPPVNRLFRRSECEGQRV